MNFKSLKMLLTACFIMVIFTQPSNAQHRKSMTFDAGEVTIVHGIGAIIKGGDKGLVIEMIPGKDRREKNYKSVDLIAQDKIIMCNGKKVKTIEDLNAALESIAIGDEVSFGVRRGKEMLIVSFPKADPSAGGGKMMMMTTTVDGDGDNEETSMMKDGVALSGIVMIEAGMILKDMDDKSTIVALLPEFVGIIEGDKLQDGDIVISINGEKNLSSEDINKSYSAINHGDKVTMTILRDSKEFMISFIKPKVDNGNSDIMIKK